MRYICAILLMFIPTLASAKYRILPPTYHTVELKKLNKRVVQFLPTVKRAAKKYDIPHSVLLAIIWKESNFRVKVLGASGEIGPTQIKPAWAKHFGFPAKALWDMSTNIDTCARILRGHYNRYRSMRAALHAYNGLTPRGAIYAMDVIQRAEVIRAQ